MPDPYYDAQAKRDREREWSRWVDFFTAQLHRTHAWQAEREADDAFRIYKRHYDREHAADSTSTAPAVRPTAEEPKP